MFCDHSASGTAGTSAVLVAMLLLCKCCGVFLCTKKARYLFVDLRNKLPTSLTGRPRFRLDLSIYIFWKRLLYYHSHRPFIVFLGCAVSYPRSAVSHDPTSDVIIYVKSCDGDDTSTTALLLWSCTTVLLCFATMMLLLVYCTVLLCLFSIGAVPAIFVSVLFWASCITEVHNK